MRSTSIFLLITSVLTFSFSAFTASAEDAAMHHHTMSSMADMPEMKKADDSATLYSASGVIKAWRDDAVVIAHSPVTELNWPAMTMPFKVADAKLLQGLQPGQTIMAMFTANEGAAPTIVSLHTM